MAEKRDSPRNPFPTDEEIAERAYEMFLQRIERSRRVRDYWEAAESELLERAARRLIPRAKP